MYLNQLERSKRAENVQNVVNVACCLLTTISSFKCREPLIYICKVESSAINEKITEHGTGSHDKYNFGLI